MGNPFCEKGSSLLDRTCIFGYWLLHAAGRGQLADSASAVEMGRMRKAWASLPNPARPSGAGRGMGKGAEEAGQQSSFTGCSAVQLKG
jgi:hypothetical protein